MSGGPVLSSFGRLVGIHGRGDQLESGSGDKTGLNLGIPINVFLQQAELSGLELSLKR